MKMKVFRKAPLWGVLFGLFIFPAVGSAWELDFHGRIQSAGILRDINGFQYDFLDETKWVQWRTELKFDLDVRPSYPKGKPSARLERVFLVYRGAYDAIFDLTDRYDNVREKSPADFELGLDDIRFENELREGFVDLVAEGGRHKANLRLGRQIVQWGEADGFNLMNIVNPSDNSFRMFFTAPEDLATPLWMAKLDHIVMSVGPFSSVSLQLLGTSDIRPHQFAPLDGIYDAPYAFIFKSFSPLVVKEDGPARTWDNMEFGARLGGFVSGWQLYLYYYDGYQDGPAMDMTGPLTAQGLAAALADPATPPPAIPVILAKLNALVASGAATTVFARHPEQKTYGFSFNTFLGSPINCVLRGEASLTKEMAFLDFEPFMNDPDNGMTFSMHKYYQALLGFDKDFHPKFIGTDSTLTTAFQIYYAKIDDWDYNPLLRVNNEEENLRLSFMMTTNYMHGAITPKIFVMYDTEGTWMTSASLNYSPDGKWYYQVSQQSFWGNKDAVSPFSPLIGTSELSFTAGYRW